MRFTPFSIKAQEFNKAVRGYDKEEVRVYLESLSNEFEILKNENDELRSKIENSSEQITEFQKLEKTLQATLVSAQESSSKAVESARKQNQLIIKEAEIKANQLLEKANKEAELIRDSVLRLNEERNLLIAKLKAMIETQANILDIGSNTFESKPLPKEDKVEVDSSEIDVDDVLEKLL
ncbi:MAG: DivIVA domain-containing protein [Melioribacteraceae bacterium]|nr:DivIVA domain-containing protein [Melioribacteraceae bacterium]